MGTYTANYNLYMPTIGEQGWGELINGNYQTIDTTMKSLSNRITAVENEVNGALSCTSVTTSGTITSAGKITANGGIECKSLTATSISNSGNMTNTGTLTSTGMIYANGGINADLSPCFGLTSASGEISSLYLSTSTNIISVTGGANTTVTRTYKENPISNSVTFTVHVNVSGYSGDYYRGRGYVKVNDITICDTGDFADTSKTVSGNATLKEGDTIVAYIYNQGYNATCYVKMECSGFLTDGS